MLERVDPAKDADGLHPMSLGRLVLGAPGPLPCTPRGIVELLRRYDVPIAGAEVVVVGRGTTVGRPLGPAADPALGERDRDAVPHRHPRPRRATPARADIVVAAAGVPGLITAGHGPARCGRARRRHHPGRGRRRQVPAGR